MIAAMAEYHVDEQLAVWCALHLPFPGTPRLTLIVRGGQRGQRVAAVHRKMFEREHVGCNQLGRRTELVRHLGTEPGQISVNRGRRRAAAGGQPAAGGVRRGNESDLPLGDRLIAVGAVKPQFVGDDATADVENVLIEPGIHDRIGVRDALGGKRRRDVVALPFGVFVGPSSAAMKRVAAGLENGHLRDAGKCDVGVVPAGLELNFFEREGIEIDSGVRGMIGCEVNPFDIERRLKDDAIRDDRGTSREIAVADVRLRLHADTRRERQHLLHRSAHWNGSELILHERRLPGRVHRVHHRTQP